MHEFKLAELKARVIAVNRAYKEANRLRPLLLELFAPMVGQKVRKIDGTLTKAVEAMLPAMPNTVPLWVYFGPSSSYSLRWHVKTCQMIHNNTNGGCLYYECSVWVGDTQNGVLELVRTAKDPAYSIYRDDYNVDTILALLDEANAASKAADRAKSACYPFSEFMGY